MRCNSSSDLFNCRSVSSSSSLSSFTALSFALWHRRLGHPGSSILSTLSHNRLISCNKIQKYFCSFISCPLGKHIKFLFKSSSILLIFHLMLYRVIYRPLLYLAHVVIVTMYYLLMISLIFCEHFPFLASLKFLLYLLIFILTLSPNLNGLLKIYKVIMVRNLQIVLDH